MKNMFLLMVKKSLTHSKNFLMFLTIFLSTALIACMLNITLNIGNKVANELRSYGSNIVMLPKSSSLNIEISGRNFMPLANEDYLNENDLHLIKEIFWQNNILAFAPFLEISGFINNEKVQITGTYFDKNIKLADDPTFKTGVINLYPFWFVNGLFPNDEKIDEIMVGEKLANRLKLNVGDNVVLNFGQNRENAKIVGILKGGDEASGKVIANLKLVQKLSNKENLYGKAEISAMTIPENDLSVKARRNLDSLDSLEYDTWYCSAYAGSIAYQIEDSVPGSITKVVLSVSGVQSEITKKIQNLMSIVTILALIISALCITSLTNGEILIRKKEIGLLKALGAKNIFIFLEFCCKNVIIGIISGIFGALFGYLLSFVIGYKLFADFIGVSFTAFVLSVIFGILICILGSILALKNILNLLPAEVFHGK